MVKIPLAGGYVALVDDEDFERVSRHHWTAEKRGKIVYSRTNTVKKREYMHRFILTAEKGSLVDHINSDGLDNRKENLRLCTHKNNLANRGANANSTSGYKGVSSDRGKWTAKIGVAGKRVHLGRYETPKEAALSYNRGATKYHGEFAKLNNA